VPAGRLETGSVKTPVEPDPVELFQFGGQVEIGIIEKDRTHPGIAEVKVPGIVGSDPYQ